MTKSSRSKPKSRCTGITLILAITLAPALLVGDGCRTASPIAPNTDKFTIAVVGDGVESKHPSPVRVYPLNRAQGLAMWQGVFAAYSQSPRLQHIKDKFNIIGFDDGGSAVEAANIARQLQRDPTVLAVIGHATSGTTRAASWLYDQAGIPLLMPIATSPYAVYPPGSEREPQKRLKYCTRLPPSDDRVQAPAVAVVVRSKLPTLSKRCYLLRDTSEDAGEYSKPLYDELVRMLSTILIDKRDLTRTESNIQMIVASIKAQSADTVVFCGYGTTAQELLAAMRVAYNDIPLPSRPNIVLTDGCKIADLNTSGFNVYLTFPLPDINNIKAETPDFNILKNAIQNRTDQSYQIYGYDAMLMLGSAFENCEKEDLSRGCIQRQLSKMNNFPGAFLGYSFVEGENVLSRYYVYWSDPNTTGNVANFTLKWEIQPDEIISQSSLTNIK